MSIHLGGSDDLEKIYLGTDELQFVYLGDDIIWQNNAGPAIQNVVLDGVALAENATISLERNTAHTISHTATDLEGDVPFTVKLFNGDTQVDTTKTIPNQGGSATFTIPASEYSDPSDAGPIDPADEWRLDVEDNAGADNQYHFMVNNLIWDPPTTGMSPTGTVVGSAATRTFSWNSANSTSGSGLTLTTERDGSSVANSGTSTVAAVCGGSASTTIKAITTANGVNETTETTLTYSRTAANSTTTCGSYGSCNASAPDKCNSTLTTCTDTGTRSRTCSTNSIRICDGAVLNSQPFIDSQACSDSATNTGYVGEVTISGPVSWKDNETGTYTATLPSLGGGVTVSNYNWSVTGSASIDSGQGTNSVVLSGPANGSGSVSLTVTFSNVSEGTTTRTSQGINYTIEDNAFTCAEANYTVSGGVAGNPVSASVSEGTLVSNSPANYVSGTNTYTGTITAPSGYSNSGSNITCTDSATSIAFELASGGASLGITTTSTGWVGSTVFLRWTTTAPYTDPNAFDGNFEFTVNSITNCTAPAGITLTPTVNVSNDFVYAAPSLTSTSYSHSPPFNQRLRWTVSAGQDISGTPGTYRCQVNMTVRPNDGGFGTIGSKAISFSVLSGRTIS